ncbi:carbohydrate ABC transporter permease [Paenibacillus roseipurpureus]|uniref:Carbohydrate ABC transporter permease n=1 Tax=Paenibacillus roseopurpureus TaxID=2918901 RepID=A0AA96LPC4_9BACL|nr:carbohydrate ABC transporter permease [Paenibacillus sp. MBLB1832]WNR45767.1 carbohydrate ABC transporter permease [Paenibacillus sp. MBLB1832]
MADIKIKQSPAERLFDVINGGFLLVVAAFIMIPVLHVVAGAFSSTNAIVQGQVGIWPVAFSWDNIHYVIANSAFWKSFQISILVVTIGTLLNIVLTVLTAYPLSKHDLKWRQGVIIYILITMIFQAPLIPTFLVVKQLGMLNTLWALIIPSAISAFNMILCLTFFRSLPEELFEAARVDGMGEYRILYQIAVPLSKPIMVTLMLFYAVGHWNNFFSALIYVTKPTLRPLQLYLYNVINGGSTNESSSALLESAMTVSPQGIQMATIVISTVPIVLIYPFIQKHFIKGALVGSLKE